MAHNVKWTPEYVAEYYQQHGSIVGKGGFYPRYTPQEDALIMSKTVPDAQLAAFLGRPLRAIHIRRSKLKGAR